VFEHDSGIVGSGAAAGEQTLSRFFPDITLEGNAIVGGRARDYPRANAFPRSLDEADNAGVDRTQLCAALAATERERYCAR
jgi:hypothetical protein